MSHIPQLQDLLSLLSFVDRQLARHYPGCHDVEVSFTARNGKRYRLPTPACDCLPAAFRPATRSHSPDFRSVNWYGVPHSFTPSQAAVVKILWEAMDNDTPEVSQQLVLSEIESDCPRLADLFKRHAAWGTMIVQGETAGSYRLAEVEK